MSSAAGKNAKRLSRKAREFLRGLHPDIKKSKDLSRKLEMGKNNHVMLSNLVWKAKTGKESQKKSLLQDKLKNVGGGFPDFVVPPLNKIPQPERRPHRNNPSPRSGTRADRRESEYISNSQFGRHTLQQQETSDALIEKLSKSSHWGGMEGGRSSKAEGSSAGPSSTRTGFGQALESASPLEGHQSLSAALKGEANWEPPAFDATQPTLAQLERITKKKSGARSIRASPPHIPIAKGEVSGVLTAPEEDCLADIEQETPPPPIAVLAHGLDRVIFNPGVHWVQDPRTRVYNFTPWLQTLPKVEEFDYNRIPAFVPSSRDNDLFSLARRQGRRFASSTSSLTGILSQCYFLISGHKLVDTSVLSAAFQNAPRSFTSAQKWPANVTMNYREGIYIIDKRNSEYDVPEKNILLWLGTALEKFLTVSKDEFGRLLRRTPIPEATLEELRKEKEAYRYAQSDDFVMRSQLDCYDSRLPGTGVFDIKTRACSPTRMDILNYEEHTGYTIKKLHGELESFEKEYYDLIRSAFLKYGFQARIGNMDGVIVAYHNTETMFGLQYVPLAEMDERLFGPGQGVGEKVFDKCVGLMEKVCGEIANCFGRQSCRATWLAKEGTNAMYVWVQPEEWDGEESERPIEQLRVEVSSYLGEDPVSGQTAVENCWNPEQPWTMQYKIQKLVVSPEKARSDMAKTLEIIAKQMYVPTGVEDVEAYWTTVAHGNATERHRAPADFDESMFRLVPPSSIMKLRELSRKGRAELEEMKETYKDEPKVVLGDRE